MQNIDVSIEYAEQLKKYMLYYGLHEVDIAFLAKTNSDTVSDVLNHSKGFGLRTLESVANAFGLRYYQFGNPDFPLPKQDKLPLITKKRIALRKKKGPPSKVSYNTLNLNDHILEILSQYKVGDKFTSSMIFFKLSKEIQELIKKPSKITDRLSDELSKFTEKTGEKHKIKGKRGRQEEYYRLIKKVPKRVQ